MFRLLVTGWGPCPLPARRLRQRPRPDQTGLASTSVATETCGQDRPAKFSRTRCEYWICVG